jgi:Flp pilus assembly protein TadD
MRCLEEHKFRLAEGHLKQALLRAPEEPAILNNLAVVLIRLNRFDEAETNAVKALKILPNSSEIKETLHRIKELKTKQK